MRTTRHARFATVLIVAITMLAVLVASPVADAVGNNDLLWAVSAGGTDLDLASDVAIDPAGNVITVGGFASVADFDPGPDTFNLTSAGSGDGFVQKLDAAGKLVWAVQIGGSVFDQAVAVAVDSAGGIYATGFFQGTADLDPGPGVLSVTSAGNRDIFVVKLDSSGNLVWAATMGGTLSDTGFGIAVDSVGSVYTTGSFSGTADFDPGVGSITLTSAGQTDIFVQKLDSSGALEWANGVGSTGLDSGYGIAVDSADQVFTTGSFSLTVDFEFGPDTTDIVSAGSGDAFFQEVDPASGKLVWVTQAGGFQFDRGNDIVAGSTGAVYTTGRFGGTADFDGSGGVSNLSSAGLSDAFVVSHSAADGALVWAVPMGGPADDIGASIDLDSVGNVYTTGLFEGTADFDPAGASAIETSVGDSDVYVHRATPVGVFDWVVTIGSVDYDEGTGIAVTSTDEIVAVGSFQDSADFNPGAVTTTLSSAGFIDAFAIKLGILPPAICAGAVVTHNLNSTTPPAMTGGADVVLGTPGADTINALAGDDRICAGAGADLVRGGSGDDIIFGEAGEDLIRGGGGSDTIDGGGSADTIFGQGGADTIDGGNGDDIINGQGAADILRGGNGADEINGQNGADIIQGQFHDDVLRGQTGPDTFEGGDGDDTMTGGNGADTLSGGAGFDRCAGNLGPDQAEAATCEQTPGVETLF